MLQKRGYTAFVLLCIVALASCARRSDDVPPARSSATFGFDGSHHLPPTGQPTTATTLSLPAPYAPTSAPLALNTNDTEIFAIAQDRIIVIGSQKSARILARSTDSTAITELLCDTANIYAIHLNGTIERFAPDGSVVWHTSVHSMPHLGAVIHSGSIVVSNDSEIVACGVANGSQKWKYHSALVPVSLAIEPKTGTLYAALSANDPSSTDSILSFDAAGTVTARSGFARTRITSNLSLCGTNGILFGSLSPSDDKSESRVAHLTFWTGIGSAAKQSWMHTLPYIVSAVANDGETVVASGFRETAGDLVSGVDAFRTSDSTTLWQRRFSYPAVTPVSLARGFAYIPFTFTTKATVPTKTILVTLDLGDGKTASELGVPNAETGFVQGVGAPIGGMLAYADRTAARIYFLKP
ncbi:MAG: hypothetical protein JSS75_12150 [Bacteroidetes bacterium]|nr:hypothetical protein [Bacteroidota bacterium]